MKVSTVLSLLCNLEVIFVVLFSYAVWWCWARGGKGRMRDIMREITGLDEPSFPQNMRIYRDSSPASGKFSRHEDRCRAIFEGIYRTPFDKIRPDWLVNPVTGRNLELDGFSPYPDTPLGRGMAFEYDGAQHSKFTPRFHGQPDDFIYQVRKDSWKDKRCREKGILLVRIPHFVSYGDLDKYIVDKLRRHGVLPLGA